MLFNQKSFSFDLGKAFINLSTFLTTKDKIQLSSTCTLLRQIFLRGNVWQIFQISDASIEIHWKNYLDWIAKYVDIIQAPILHLEITKQDHEEDEQLKRILLNKKSYVQELSIRTNSAPLHLALAFSCQNVSKILFLSNCISDELATKMFKWLKNISELEIRCDAYEFTCSNIYKYLEHPLQKLILKPYQLDYQSILKLVSSQTLNDLNELQIDVQQCQQQQLLEIVSHLKHISRLRLFHMEGITQIQFSKQIAKRLSSQMKQLTLTKCYALQMQQIIQKIASPFFQRLNLTEATKLRDQSVLLLANRCCNLKQVNFSWCNQLTNNSVSKLINNCILLEKIHLSGLKNLNDNAFEEYLPFIPAFKQQTYDKLKYDFRRRCKDAKQNDISSIEKQYQEKSKIQNIFNRQSNLLQRRKTLTNLRYLDCAKCNSISDKILKIIYSFNRMAKVFNYYEEDLSFTRNILEEELMN